MHYLRINDALVAFVGYTLFIKLNDRFLSTFNWHRLSQQLRLG